MSSKRGLVSLVLLALVACGGGGGYNSNMPPPGPPPSGLSYPAPPSYTIHEAIAPLSPTVTGSVSSYGISPALPPGLSLNASTGVISGTPTSVAARQTYTVTAANASGMDSTGVSIAVNDAAPIIAYRSPYYAFTRRRAGQTDTPKVTGGAVTSWNVVPTLPPGLMLSSTDGTISGTPNAAAAPAVYEVTAMNSGGQSSATLTLAVAPGPVLDLGHNAAVTFLRFVGSSVLSEDFLGHWVLWDFTTGGMLASGGAVYVPAVPALDVGAYVGTVDLGGAIAVIQTASGLEVRSATSGHVLAEIATNALTRIPSPPLTSGTVPWWKVAADGSYIVAGTPSGLVVWSPSGTLLLNRPGDYFPASAFAAPGQVQVALGPAGSSVIETIAVPSGASTTSSPFQGTFQSWFTDGTRFLTSVAATNTALVYSSAGVQQDIRVVPGLTGLAGTGNWYWIESAGQLYLFAVGVDAQAPVTYTLASNVQAIPSGTELALFTPDVGPGQVSVVDLSGAAPVKTDYSAPFGNLTTFAATSSSAWLIGAGGGLLVDGSSLAGQPRYFDYGSALSIAGSASSYVIATASGRILVFDAATNALQTTIEFPSSSVSLSSDGTVLAALATNVYYQYFPDRTVNVYSLPAGTLVHSFPFTYGTNAYPLQMALAGSGRVLYLGLTPNSTCDNEVIPVAGGAPLWCEDSGKITQVQLSPDGTLIAASPAVTGGDSAVNIYSNGNLSATVPGWAVGWIDNNQLLVNTMQGSEGLTYAGSTIYSANGAKLASPSLPELDVLQPMSSGAFYSPFFSQVLLYGFGEVPGGGDPINVIFSVPSGAELWANATQFPSFPGNGVGAVAGSEVVFTVSNLVLAEPH